MTTKEIEESFEKLTKEINTAKGKTTKLEKVVTELKEEVAQLSKK